MPDDFSPAMNPSINSRNPISFNVREVQFGDGYSQRAGDGINNIKRAWDLNWDMLSFDQAKDIQTFLENKGGWQSFTYTVPSDIQRKYKCKTFTPAFASGEFFSLSATFEEVL